MITSTTNGRSRLMGVMTKDRARVTSTTDKRVCKSFMLCELIIYFHYTQHSKASVARSNCRVLSFMQVHIRITIYPHSRTNLW